MSENHPDRLEPGSDDTQPLSSGEPRNPVTDPGGAPQDPYGQDSYGQGPYGQEQYGQDPYGWGPATGPLPPGWYQQPPPPPQPRGQVPGWMIPLVAGIALLVGLVGGTVGGALVSSSVNDSGFGGPSVFEAEEEVPAPLEPQNGSVAAVAEQLLPSTVQILTRGGGPAGKATGSGFVTDRSGHVITNNHVVAGVAEGGRIRVIDHVGRTHSASIVGRSPVYDIAVLDVEGAERLRPAALGSSHAMNVGETVVAIGSPLGLSSTVTSGIVSALDRPVTTGDEDESSYINAVQTDAAINPGNSGGPLVNLRGEVVGVNSAIATMGGFAGESGNIGVGFAIPMEQVRVTAAQILRTGVAKYPVIGANVNTGSRRSGAQIVEVPAGTPADDAGLEKGDIVVGVNGAPVNDGIELIVAIRSHRPGDTVTLTVKRDGVQEDVRVRLDAKVG